MKQEDIGYVLINRGKDQGEVERFAFAYANTKSKSLSDQKEYHALEALNSETQVNYSTFMFEEE